MKQMAEHIAQLEKLLCSKGYDGYFFSAGAYPGRLAESLGRFVAAYDKGEDYGIKFPPALTTYCYWFGEGKESMECRFMLDFQQDKGLR